MASVLYKGIKSDEVKNLQTILNNNGYNLAVDGSFGSLTDAAVRDYQSKNGLEVDGHVGPQTWAALTGAGSASNPAATSTPAPTGLAAVEASRPVMTNTFSDQLADLTNRILNREKFSYDFNADPIYKKYRDQYIAAGQKASENVQAQAAALSGGYGNSYGASAAAQAYNDYLTKLGDIVPSLEEQAWERWRQEGSDLQNQYSLLRAAANDEYNRQQDALAQWNKDRAFEYQKEQDELAAAQAAMKAASSSSGGSRSSSSRSSSGSSSSGSGSLATATLNDHIGTVAELIRLGGESYAQDYLWVRANNGELSADEARTILERAKTASHKVNKSYTDWAQKYIDSYNY